MKKELLLSFLQELDTVLNSSGELHTKFNSPFKRPISVLASSSSLFKLKIVSSCFFYYPGLHTEIAVLRQYDQITNCASTPPVKPQATVLAPCPLAKLPPASPHLPDKVIPLVAIFTLYLTYNSVLTNGYIKKPIKSSYLNSLTCY
jgi:hypothetical protein